MAAAVAQEARRVTPVFPRREISPFERHKLDQVMEPRLVTKTAVPDIFLDAFIDKKEIDMNVPWGSFAQVVLTNEVQDAGGHKIKKGIGMSIPYPPGVSREMANEILSLALNFENSQDQRWKGEGGDIICKSEDVGDAPYDLRVLKRLVLASAVVIARDHPQKEHERVQDFLRQTTERLRFIDDVVIPDAIHILTTPDSTGWSAMNQRYQGKGKVYLLAFQKGADGIVKGSTPDGKMRALRELATDETHSAWINEGLIKLFDQDGNVKAGDWEDTNSVPQCGGLDEDEPSGCSTFFRLMESGDLFKSADSIRELDEYQYLVTYKTLQAGEEKIGMCPQCQKPRESCTGHVAGEEVGYAAE